jgi:exosome complex component RRP41
MLSAIAAGKADKTLLVDVDKAEEDFHDGEGATDIPLAITSRSKEIALLQLDGKISPSELTEAIEMAKKACDDILKVQMAALKGVAGESNE